MTNPLKARIARQHKNRPPLRPAGAPMPPGVPAPTSRMVITPGTVGMAPMSPLITSDGAEVPATGPGQWDQLAAAGRTG